MTRGYFEIGIVNSKTPANLGTLWRSAFQLGAAGIFTIGHRYPKQPSDTVQAFRHIPLRQFETFEQFLAARPHDCALIAIETGGRPLGQFIHPERAMYLLGAEDKGLPQKVLDHCQHVLSIETARVESYNVAVAGSLAMYSRLMGSA